MPLKASDPANRFREVDRWEGGAGWIAHPEETMERASHALAVDGDVWVVDPLDAPGVDDLLAEFGTVAGVVVLIDRHARDAETFARRHDVPVYLPPFVDREFGVPVERFTSELDDTGFDLLRSVDWPGWREGALCDGETLVLADALGTAAYFTARDERLGVSPLLRLSPPWSLGNVEPERVLVGHGAGVMHDGTRALDEALDGARRNLAGVLLNGLRAMV